MSTSSAIDAYPFSVLPVGVAVVLYLVYWAFTFGSRASNLPPGPKTVPILGNLNIFPRKFLHLTFTEWAKVYGDVFSLKVMNQTIIVLNSPTAVRELIDKRSLSTSNRPKSILADMITPHNLNLGTGRYANETWRVLRKAATYPLSNENIRRLANVQHAEATQLMWDLTHSPDKWYTHVQRFTASFALSLIYGARSPRSTSPDVAEFLTVHPQFLGALEMGKLPPVDLFPVLTWVPERWAAWKRTVKHIRTLHENLFERLLRRVEARIERGETTGAFMEDALTHGKEWGLDRRELFTNLGGTLLQGSDTSSASLQNAILALVCFPEVQKKARAELDRVVGTDRAPTWDDLPNLPYTMAFIEESHRFRPAGPLGLPHEMVEDEIVDGVLYPKSAIVFLNIWGIFRDEKYFDRPYEFMPERFLTHPLGVKPGVEDDPARRVNMLFGGGRRVCPGIAFARTSLEINVANFVWGFNFLPALDPVTNKEVFPDPDNYSTSITATPYPFKCRIEPRSQGHLDIINRQFAAAAEFLAPYELELTEDDRAFNARYRDAA